MIMTMLTLALTVSAQAADLPPADLAALLREAEANNPELAAAASMTAAAGAVPSQMEALPDPVAGVSYTNVGLTDSTLGDDGDTMLTLSWSQEVPYPGKLRLAGDAARREMEMAHLRADLIRLTLAARVKQAYTELYHADRSTVILRESRELLISFMETARVRYESGSGMLENVLKAQTEITKLDAEMEKLAEERRTAQAMLDTLAGRVADEAIGPALALPDSSRDLDAARLEADALARSPELLEMDAAVRREEARLDLARRQTKPDFLWGAGYGYRGGLDPEIMGSFGVKLPLYQQRKQAQGIVMASHQLDAAKQQAAAARLRIAGEVRQLLARVARADALSRLYSEAAVPQSRSALDSAAASYGVGRADFLTLLSDFNSALTYELDYVTQRHERIQALASLEKLTARVLIFPESSEPEPERRTP